MMHNRPGLGIGMMVAGCLALTISDAGVKLLTDTLSAGQILVGKSLFTVIVLALASPMIGMRRMFRITSWPGQLGRVLFTVAGSFLFVYALKALPLSTAVMLAFASPLFVTALAPLFLGEHVGARSWAAVIAGFVGVAIIVQPSGDAFSLAMLLPLGAAFTSAMRDIVTRRIASSETTESMIFYTFATVGVVAFVVTPVDPFNIGWPAWRLIALSAIAHLAALYLMIESVRNAEAATVAPFKYSNLLWVTAFQFLIWGDLPAWNVIVGACVIVAAMLYLLHRARVRRRLTQPDATVDAALPISLEGSAPSPETKIAPASKVE